jgi:hypothetical protein
MKPVLVLSGSQDIGFSIVLGPRHSELRIFKRTFEQKTTTMYVLSLISLLIFGSYVSMVGLEALRAKAMAVRVLLI